jgi:hypothetical protein
MFSDRLSSAGFFEMCVDESLPAYRRGNDLTPVEPSIVEPHCLRGPESVARSFDVEGDAVVAAVAPSPLLEGGQRTLYPWYPLTVHTCVHILARGFRVGRPVAWCCLFPGRSRTNRCATQAVARRGLLPTGLRGVCQGPFRLFLYKPSRYSFRSAGPTTRAGRGPVFVLAIVAGTISCRCGDRPAPLPGGERRCYCARRPVAIRRYARGRAEAADAADGVHRLRRKALRTCPRCPCAPRSSGRSGPHRWRLWTPGFRRLAGGIHWWAFPPRGLDGAVRGEPARAEQARLQ